MRNHSNMRPGPDGRAAGPRGGGPGAGPRRCRIALYSHDAMGIGHLRRNQLIAGTLAASPLRPEILLIAGAREATAFAMPAGIDCVTLPSLCKGEGGAYRPRCLEMPLDELIALRAKVIAAAIEAFAPDVLIVDKVPRGVLDELVPALDALRWDGRTRCILGLRDVLDDPEAVRREWSDAAYEEAILNYYDGVWVYGDPCVYDPVREYAFPAAVASKVRYTGYLDRRAWPAGRVDGDRGRCPALDLPPGRLALCMVGGGQDGARLAEAFAAAEVPPETCAAILTGPFMPPESRDRLRRIAGAHPRKQVLDFTANPECLLDRADRVVAMGGYNTVCEVLSYEKHTLIVPRVEPRREQLVRAERLHALGLLDVLHPDRATPGALADWLARDLGPPPRARDRIDLDGLTRLPGLLDEILGVPSHHGPGRLREGAIAHVSA